MKIEKKALLSALLCVGMVYLIGCGTTKSIVQNQALSTTSTPIFAKLEIGRNTGDTADQLRSPTGITLAVEPHSVIKVYNDLYVLQPYSTTADGLGRFQLDIGNSLRPVALMTATAPYKNESDFLAVINLN